MSTYRLKGASGEVINQSFMLGTCAVIGRADDCELRLEQDGIADHHAEISVSENGSLTLRRLNSSFEVMLNGQSVETAQLTSGDEIRVGNCRFLLQAPGLRPEKILTAEAARPRRAYLPWLIVVALLAAAAMAWFSGLLRFA